MLGTLIDVQKKDGEAFQNETPLSKKIDAITQAVKQISKTDTDVIVAVLQERLPEVVQTLVSNK